MSKKQSQQNVPTLSPIANAMYNAQREEIKSSVITSLLFLIIGAAVTVFSVFKYFKITGNMTDSSEKFDAYAWLAIVAIGVGVVAIGIVNMLKTFGALSQLSSLLKRTESHASPFQDQQLSKRVAQMNQSQALKNAEMVSAEQRKSDKKKGFGMFGKKTMSSSELYDKYNPQQKNASTQRMTAPPKAKPMMEQKFDYGIHEKKELTFADEFLMKNKRDPFAQYRKELGIKEEHTAQTFEQKPQFINANATAKKAPTIQVGSSSISGLDLGSVSTVSPKDAGVNKPASTGKSLLSELDFSGSFGSDTSSAPVQQPIKQQAKPKSLLSELDFGGSFGTDTDTPAVQEAPAAQPKPRSLLSELDFGGSFGSDTDKPAVQEAPAAQPKPRSLLSELDFGGSFGSDTDKPAVQETPAVQPRPRSLLSELDFGGSFESDTNTPSVQETPAPQPKPRSLLSELDFGGTFDSSDNTPSAPAEPAAIPQPQPEVKKAPVNDPVAQRASVKMISFLSDKSNDSFVDITGVEKITNNQTVGNGNSTPYGMHREEDDGMFFAPRTNNTGFTQQQSRPKAQTQTQQQSRPKAQTQTQQQSRPLPSAQTASYNLENFTDKKQQRPNSKDFSSDIVKNGTPAQRKYVEASAFDEWTCPQCGKTNQEYVGVCACGRRKPRSKF